MGTPLILSDANSDEVPAEVFNLDTTYSDTEVVPDPVRRTFVGILAKGATLLGLGNTLTACVTGTSDKTNDVMADLAEPTTPEISTSPLISAMEKQGFTNVRMADRDTCEALAKPVSPDNISALFEDFDDISCHTISFAFNGVNGFLIVSEDEKGAYMYYGTMLERFETSGPDELAKEIRDTIEWDGVMPISAYDLRNMGFTHIKDLPSCKDSQKICRPGFTFEYLGEPATIYVMKISPLRIRLDAYNQTTDTDADNPNDALNNVRAFLRFFKARDVMSEKGINLQTISPALDTKGNQNGIKVSVVYLEQRADFVLIEENGPLHCVFNGEKTSLNRDIELAVDEMEQLINRYVEIKTAETELSESGVNSSDLEICNPDDCIMTEAEYYGTKVVTRIEKMMTKK